MSYITFWKLSSKIFKYVTTVPRKRHIRRPVVPELRDVRVREIRVIRLYYNTLFFYNNICIYREVKTDTKQNQRNWRWSTIMDGAAKIRGCECAQQIDAYNIIILANINFNINKNYFNIGNIIILLLCWSTEIYWVIRRVGVRRGWSERITIYFILHSLRSIYRSGNVYNM